jgi:hypothetical protein
VLVQIQLVDYLVVDLIQQFNKCIDFITICNYRKCTRLWRFNCKQEKSLVLVHHQLVVYLVVDIAPTSKCNTIDYVTIITGNAIDFGDLTQAQEVAACSNGHGGL